MNSEQNNTNLSEDVEKISLNKLGWIIRKNWIWLFTIILVTVVSSYLYTRWTKPLYQANSEIKLEIETDVSEFGIGGFVEEKNLGVLSGEIELLKSRLFFQKLLDSIDLSVSYFTQGRVLMEEKYPLSPISIDFELKNTSLIDQKIFVEFDTQESFSFYTEEGEKYGPFPINKRIDSKDLVLTMKINPSILDLTEHKFVFIINSRESLQDYIDANLNVKFLNLKANTIQISFQDYNSAKAKDIVNTINSIYIKYTREEKSRANRNKIDWIDNQLSKIESDLEEFENYFEDFTIENRTNDLDADLKETVRNINLLDSQQYEVTRRLELSQQLILVIDSSRIISPSRLLPIEIREGIGKMNELFLERDQLGMSYKESTFAIQSKDREILSHKDALHNILKEYKIRLVSSLDQIQKKKDDLEKSFVQIPGKSTEFNKKLRFYNLYEEFYLSLMQSKAEFEIAVAGITPNFKILEPAKVSPKPVSPNKLLVQGAGVGMGIILSVFFVGFRYLIEDKINSIEEVEEIVNFPVIGSIPRSRLSTSDNRLVLSSHPKSGVSEAMRTIRTNIQFFIPEKQSHVIAITSSVSGEGKSFVAANLAATLAASNKKVCLLDLDMRKPSIHRTFNYDNMPKGVSTLLIQKDSLEDCITSTDIEGLDFIPAGPIPPNPSELLSNGNFTSLLLALQEKYDMVLLDTPPIGLVTDGILAIKQSHLSILIVREDYTRKKDIKFALRNLRLAESKITVLYNGQDRRGTYAYSKGYYSDNKS